MANNANAESSFRAQLAGFRWAQGRTDDSQQTQSSGENTNLFSRLTNGISGYVPLRSSERTNEEEAYFALSRWERFLGFLACLAGAAVLFLISFLTLPMVPIRPHKFALAFSLGSFLVMVGFSVLSGPITHLRHILSPARLPFSIAYFGSLALTIYFAVGPRWYLPTLICAIVQVAALLSYIVAYFPGGTTTLAFGSRMIARGGASLLPF